MIENNNSNFDVIVMGGGPAGSTIASILARADAAVVSVGRSTRRLANATIARWGLVQR